MDEKFDQAFQQAAAFQRMWADSFSQMAEVWTKSSPGKPPPEAVREMRADMLKVLSDSWDQFMRTPQFMEYMRHSMDGLLTLRRMTADALTRNQHEAQAPAREDIDGLLLAIRHMERRLLDRIEEVDHGVAAVGQRIDKLEKGGNGTAPKKRARRAAAKKPSAKGTR